MTAVFLTLPLLLATVLPLSAELLQVQVLHRHGARLHLFKSPTDPSREAGGADLLPLGVNQLTNLGSALRARYYTRDAPAPLAGATGVYTGAADIHALSSDTARTLASSRALLAGLVPDDALRVPTYVLADEANDWALRGYSMCPALGVAVEAFIESDVFRRKADDVEGDGVLSSVAAGIDEDVQLASAFNTYDRYVLDRSGATESELPTIDADAFAGVKEAADWVETSKYVQPAVAKNLVGGGVAWQMLKFAAAMENVGDVAGKHRIVDISGHYPLIMGVLSVLGIDGSKFGDDFGATANVTSTIPGFGAALIWELHTDSQVRLFWRGGMDQKFAAIPCGNDGTTVQCSLGDLRKRVESAGAISSAAQFCKACGSDDNVNGLLCSRRDVVEEKSFHLWSRIVYFAAGLAMGAVGVLLGLRCCGPLQQKRLLQRAPISPLVGSSSGDSGSTQPDLSSSPFEADGRV